MPDKSLSLTELNLKVRDAIRDHPPDTYWIRAETSDVRPNRNGHCYLEFIEKDAARQSIIAKARGIIWSGVFHMLSAYFEKGDRPAVYIGIECTCQGIGGVSRAIWLLPQRS